MEKVLNEILLKLSNLEDGQRGLMGTVSQLDTKVDNLDVKVDYLDVKVDNLDVKVDNLDVKVENLDVKVDCLESNLHEIRDIVTRIEVSQNEDVIALLKTFNSKIDSKSEALNKRLFRVESKLEASK
ncbi:hypothetical protein [Fictibacillus barbaricus]|uniref:RNase H-like nuclease (RuvC/YqgF family) n=1 Tax=Fictibacillus barbaricus TaxID=182136 RepID=A0ABU1U199_9BACL|nr:hypothetical protein [Fictibacillus barbaricus]MDR7073255.1 putative RNase H-like nuclease (RuvC/YqgF family) [Fictibacillus barbaricus]